MKDSLFLLKCCYLVAIGLHLGRVFAKSNGSTSGALEGLQRGIELGIKKSGFEPTKSIITLLCF